MEPISGSRPGGRPPDPDPCVVCGGDGRLRNAWGQVANCPSCHGSGRRQETLGFHDVTKTKPEHHHPRTNGAPAVAKRVWPSTPAGDLLAQNVRDATGLSAEAKARLTLEITEHEATHGQCTKTFLRKIRKQLGSRP